MKAFSFASAIESGNYNGQETYQSGSIDVADVTIRDSNKVGWGTISYDTGFAYSSNVAATKLALKMGTKTLSKYYDELGFGKTTGIELSGEAKGDADFTYQSELATAAFGQGITVTPIQILQALSTIANDGVLLKPYLVQKIVDKNGNITYQGKRTELGQVYSKTTTDYMKKLMYDVVYNGLSPMWQPNNVTLIAKTGTAQIASPKGGYLDGDYDVIRSLAGMFPQDNPQYVIYVATKKMIGPKPGLASIVAKAVEEIASYAKITNEDVKTAALYQPITIENYLSNEIEPTKKSLTDAGLKVYVLGTGKYVINQFPLKGSITFAGNKVFLLSNANDYVVPNFIGWSRSEVNTFASLINKTIKVNGYGYVKSQNVAAATPIVDDTAIEVNLE
jgi:penicillin-binding protein 2B